MFFIQITDYEFFNQTILIVGAGLVALEAVYQAARLGHPVILVTPFFLPIQGDVNADIKILSKFFIKLPFNVRVITNAIVVGLKGRNGCFIAYLDSIATGREVIICGAIVLAPSGIKQIELLPINFNSRNIIPVSDLNFSIFLDNLVKRPLQIAIFAGIMEPISALDFYELMKIALKLQLHSGTQVTVFFSEACVATEDGEYYYRAARRVGVKLVRIEFNELKLDKDGYSLIWYDKVLEQKIKFNPDIVAASESVIVNPFLFCKKLVLLSIYNKLLTKNIILGSYRTKVGFYILGSLFNISSKSFQIAEPNSAMLEAHELLTKDDRSSLLNINTQLCSYCLTCVRICPQGVFYYQDNRICYSTSGCLVCGICVEYCPAMAITLSGLSHFEIIKGLYQDTKKLSQPFLVIISCIHSAYKAYEELINSGFPFSRNLLHIQVPCIGRVGSHLLLSILEMGAVGILVVGCQQDNCRSLFGNKLALTAVNFIHNNLSKLQIGVDNIRIILLASNQYQNLSKILIDILIPYY